MKRLKLPQIDSIEDLAQFWDTHDLTEFEEELEEVTEAVFSRKAVFGQLGCAGALAAQGRKK